MANARIDRVSADDLMSLATERGRTPLQAGAVLLLETGSGFDPEGLARAIQGRLPAIPRLRKVLLPVAFGCGRPIWSDYPAFRIEDHVSIRQCPAPGGPEGLLAVAAETIVRRLDRDRPLWSAMIVTEVGPSTAALIVVFHHVLADGMAGLAVLAGLADGGRTPPDPDFPRLRPSGAALARDAVAERLAGVRHFPGAVARLLAGASQLRPAVFAHLDPSSLNRPTGPLRRFATVAVPLERVRIAAHEHGATVNDVLLAAIASALRRLLADRGEALDEFVISVPFSSRSQAVATDLGNQSGVIPMRLPAMGPQLLERVAAITRAAKLEHRAASTALLGPLFRLLARSGVYQRFIDRQRMINTFVTNLRGPEHRLSIGGLPITGIVPLSVTTGNVTVSFAALSYAGTLTITIIADPTACPDLDLLRDLLEHELTAARP